MYVPYLLAGAGAGAGAGASDAMVTMMADGWTRDSKADAISIQKNEVQC